METLGKASVIAKAWEDSVMGMIPKNKEDYPDWYRRRLEACESCPRNTRNMRWRDVPLKAKLQALTGRWACSICGCFLREKAWMRTESCPLAEVGETPRWEALSVVTVDRSAFDIDTDDESIGLSLSDDGHAFVVDVHDVNIGDKIPVRIRIHNELGFHPTNKHLGCGCIGDVKYPDGPDENMDTPVEFVLDTSNYREGPFRKSMGLEGYRGEDPKRRRSYFPLEIRGIAHFKDKGHA